MLISDDQIENPTFHEHDDFDRNEDFKDNLDINEEKKESLEEAKKKNIQVILGIFPFFNRKFLLFILSLVKKILYIKFCFFLNYEFIVFEIFELICKQNYYVLRLL